MAGKQQLPDSIFAEILSHLRKGASFNAIKNEIGVSLYTIGKVAKNNGIERKAGQSKGCVYQPKKYERTMAHYCFSQANKGESFIYDSF